MEYRYTYAAGRNRTATDRAGTRMHAVPRQDGAAHGDDFAKALCGFRPGWRGNGWSTYEADECTCPRCLKKMEAMR